METSGGSGQRAGRKGTRTFEDLMAGKVEGSEDSSGMTIAQNSSLVDATTVESLEEALLETNHFSFRSGSLINKTGP